jgi:hypothetical protein
MDDDEDRDHLQDIGVLLCNDVPDCYEDFISSVQWTYNLNKTDLPKQRYVVLPPPVWNIPELYGTIKTP